MVNAWSWHPPPPPGAIDPRKGQARQDARRGPRRRDVESSSSEGEPGTEPLIGGDPIPQNKQRSGCLRRKPLGAMTIALRSPWVRKLGLFGLCAYYGRKSTVLGPVGLLGALWCVAHL